MRAEPLTAIAGFAALLREHGLRTFDTGEMADELLALCTNDKRAECERAGWETRLELPFDHSVRWEAATPRRVSWWRWALRQHGPGEIVQIGHHDEANVPIYLVDFGVVVLGCLEEEIAPMAEALA